MMKTLLRHLSPKRTKENKEYLGTKPTYPSLAPKITKHLDYKFVFQIFILSKYGLFLENIDL